MKSVWKRCDRFLNTFSWLVLAAEVVYIVLRSVLSQSTVVELDRYAAWFMPVLLAGAVGYVTNWLALWYLFKPYEPHLGGRIQGIIPRQKKEMAVSLGRMVGTKLLDPNALVNELQTEVSAFVRDPDRMAALRGWIQKYLLEHESEIVEFITPYVERQVLAVIDSVATDETWGKVWDEGILPRIRSEKSRTFVVAKLVEAIRENAGGIIDEVRSELRAYLMDKLDYPLVPTTMIVDLVMTNFADYGSMKSKLDSWLQREETQAMLRTKLLEYADQLTAWMKGDEGREIMSGVVRELKVRGKRFLSTYIREKVPLLIDEAFASELVRDKLERVVLPKVGDRLVLLIGENKQTILDKLRLDERVTEAVNGMQVKDFHEMMNDFMSENFCAVQVLGFILGALVGALQLLTHINQ